MLAKLVETISEKFCDVILGTTSTLPTIKVYNTDNNGKYIRNCGHNSIKTWGQTSKLKNIIYLLYRSKGLNTWGKKSRGQEGNAREMGEIV